MVRQVFAKAMLLGNDEDNLALFQDVAFPAITTVVRQHLGEQKKKAVTLAHVGYMLQAFAYVMHALELDNAMVSHGTVEPELCNTIQYTTVANHWQRD